jgi:hypothetical protein
MYMLTVIYSVGQMVMIIPVYQAELCHPDIRGTVTALQQFMLGVGALIAAWTSYGTFHCYYRRIGQCSDNHR